MQSEIPLVKNRKAMSRRPLTASSADQSLFVNRDAETRGILSALDLGLNTFVSGPPGSGKTSLLRHAQRALDDARRMAAYVSTESAQTASEAINLIARALDSGGEVDTAEAGDETDVGAIELAAGDREIIILVDGLDERTTAVLFGRYRDRLWESPKLSWVAASRHRSPAAPADAFFDRVLELAPFTQADADLLLQARASWMPAATRRQLVDGLGPVQPLLLMLAAQSVAIADIEPKELLEALATQRQLMGELPERLRPLYEALLDVGPVHAGDEELLARVGVSRPTVATRLKELEDLGLAQSEREGRRVLYRTLRNAIVHSSPAPLDAALEALLRTSR